MHTRKEEIISFLRRVAAGDVRTINRRTTAELSLSSSVFLSNDDRTRLLLFDSQNQTPHAGDSAIMDQTSWLHLGRPSSPFTPYLATPQLGKPAKEDISLIGAGDGRIDGA